MNINNLTLLEYCNHQFNNQILFTTPLITSGLIDSFQVQCLVSYLEHRYDIEIPNHDVTVKHFDSVEKIYDYLGGV